MKMDVGSVACFGNRHGNCPEATGPKGDGRFLCECPCHKQEVKHD